MPPIRQLSPGMINKIAAGEVIERPASVVKELMENSVDAGAARIDVGLEQGGNDLVRVADDGAGIPPEELLLAVASHATSKLVEADDLFRVRTLGFRGEALASIAEISRFTIRSRPAAAAAGAELLVEGGEHSGSVPCGCPPGTTIEVRNLFFNTPVRRKFLRATQTEIGHVTEAFTRLALAHHSIHFTLKHNNRSLFDLPPAENRLDRVERFFGGELADALVWVDSVHDDVRLHGHVAHPSQSRANNRMQYLFLNGRCIRDRSLQHALNEAYRGLLLTGRFPISFLCIDMPPELVDVNVHPTKLEVRFQDGGRLYSQLLGTLRTKFLSTDLTHRLDPSRGVAAAGESATAQQAAQLRDELVQWAKDQVQTWAPGEAAPLSAPAGDAGRAAAPLSLVQIGPEQALTARMDFSGIVPANAAFPAESGRPADDWFTRRPAAEAQPAGAAAPLSADRHAALQIHNRYLVAESEDGVVVIDQHALHERILYGQLKRAMSRGALERQTLLIPEPVDLTPEEAAAVMAHRELLANLGVQVEPFGGGTLLVSSYPAIMGGTGAADVLRELVERLLETGQAPARHELVDAVLHMMACKAAVKAGDHLTPDEIRSLLEQRHIAEDSHHCPHGRPTALVFTRADLDRQFKRT